MPPLGLFGAFFTAPVSRGARRFLRSRRRRRPGCAPPARPCAPPLRAARCALRARPALLPPARVRGGPARARRRGTGRRAFPGGVCARRAAPLKFAPWLRFSAGQARSAGAAALPAAPAPSAASVCPRGLPAKRRGVSFEATAPRESKQIGRIQGIPLTLTKAGESPRTELENRLVYTARGVRAPRRAPASFLPSVLRRSFSAGLCVDRTLTCAKKREGALPDCYAQHGRRILELSPLIQLDILKYLI